MSFPRHLRKKRPKPRPNPKPGRLDLRSVKLRSSALGRCRFVLALFSTLRLFRRDPICSLATRHDSEPLAAHATASSRGVGEPGTGAEMPNTIRTVPTY